MATLSAGGATVVFKAERGGSRVALRSDRKVLWQHRGGGEWGGWSIKGRLKDGVTPAESLAAYEQYGYVRIDKGSRTMATASELKAKLNGKRSIHGATVAKPGPVTARYASPEAELAALQAQNATLKGDAVTVSAASVPVAATVQPVAETGLSKHGLADAVRMATDTIGELRQALAVAVNQRDKALAEVKRLQANPAAAPVASKPANIRSGSRFTANGKGYSDFDTASTAAAAAGDAVVAKLVDGAYVTVATFAAGKRVWS